MCIGGLVWTYSTISGHVDTGVVVGISPKWITVLDRENRRVPYLRTSEVFRSFESLKKKYPDAEI